MIDAKVQSTIYISTGYTDTNNNNNNNIQNPNNDNDFGHIYALTMPSTTGHRNNAQLLDSLAWLEGVPNTPSPLGFDDFGLDLEWEQSQQQSSLSQDYLLDPPLFPSPATTFFDNAALFAPAPSPANSQSQQSLLGLSPSSSTTLDADSLLSFDTMTAPAASASQSQGAMSDAEFQLLLDGLSPEDVAAMLPTDLPCEPFVPVSVPMPLPMPAMPVDNFALHAFPSLDLFTPSMDAVVPPVVPVPAPVPSPSPAPDAQGGIRCRTCYRAYPTLCRLRKHEHTHTRPFACTVCHKGHAAKKDLHRHLWSTHPDEAAAMGIPNPMRVCPVAGCGFESRQDNLTRHIRTKHAGEV
ncbi:hypothetical protein Sste5346_006930 [Sporothrix stenoceras]|uniref:C2H2-type domain-containing protein n=1 Tax=Sporothrix stenoceras TaxID=5173 RepID=A0ABR3YW82_9PEZI